MENNYPGNPCEGFNLNKGLKMTKPFKVNSSEPLAKLRAKSNNQQVTLDNTLQVIDYWF